MKTKSILLILGSLLAGLVPRTTGATEFYTGDNLLQNGGFNAQGFPYPSDFSLILAPWHWSGSVAYTWANNSQLVTLGPGATVDAGGYVGFGDGLIYQDVATMPGQTYELTIIAHSRGTAAGTWLQPLWNGSSLEPGLAKYWEWTVIRYDIQASGNNTRLTIMPVPNNGGPTWVDSVNLVAIPEPSAPALLIMSGSVVFLFRRWRALG